MISQSDTIGKTPAGKNTTDELSPGGSAVLACVAIFFVLGMGAGAIGGFVALFRSSGSFPLIGIPVVTVGGAIGGAIAGGIIGLFVAPIATLMARRKQKPGAVAESPIPTDDPTPE